MVVYNFFQTIREIQNLLPGPCTSTTAVTWYCPKNLYHTKENFLFTLIVLEPQYVNSYMIAWDQTAHIVNFFLFGFYLALVIYFCASSYHFLHLSVDLLNFLWGRSVGL